MTVSRGKASEAGLTITLTLECTDEGAAAALDQALMPDNRYFPKDQGFKSSREGNLLKFEIGSPRIRPALATVASLISDAGLFGDVWVEAKTRGLGSAAAQ